MGSNIDYYRIILDACKYYVEAYTQRVYLHINGNPQPNLQSEIQEEFNFLRTATAAEIFKKINSKDEITKFNVVNNYQNLANGIESSEGIITTNDSRNTNQFEQENGDQVFYQHGQQYDNKQIDMEPEYN